MIARSLPVPLIIPMLWILASCHNQGAAGPRFPASSGMPDAAPRHVLEWNYDGGQCSVGITRTNRSCLLRGLSNSENSLSTDGSLAILHLSIGDGPEYEERLACGEVGHPCGFEFKCDCLGW